MKVNKRIGKLKQWTGEKLGGQQKTELSEDFQSLEQDVELRKAGVDRIYSVSKEYSKHLTKKIEAEGTETGKVLPADALGLVFANHGDEFGNDSAFGQALVAFGKAQQQLANVTANYTDQLNSGWLSSLEKSIAQMSEYTTQRKKLDSRRLTYDAMLAKVQKSKKEKRDLEDDLRVAKNRYEETSEEVQERAIGIQDAESEQLTALSKFLEIESAWIDEQKKIMDDLRRHWVDQNALKCAGRKKVTAHTFGAEPAPAAKPSINSKTARPAVRNNAKNQGLSSDQEEEEDQLPASDEQEEPEDEEDYEPQRRKSKASVKPTRPNPVTRDSSIREKVVSPPRYGGVRIPGMPPASNSEESLSPKHDPPAKRRSSNVLKQQQVPSSSPGMRRSSTAPSKPATKVLKAKWAYSATAGDELELEVGDRVKVTSEVNAEWFIGTNEATGETGMFPSAYCVADETVHNAHKFLIPETSDTFADPEEEEEEEEQEEEDESEAAALRPHQSATLPMVRHTPSIAKLGLPNSSASTGKRAPPPPPTRRAMTTTSAPKASHHPLSSSINGGGGGETHSDQPEAFGSVSELKKRLGMFK